MLIPRAAAKLHRSALLSLSLLLLSGSLAAQSRSVAFDSPEWTFDARQAARVEHLGRPALRLESGMAWLPQAAFTNGIIEFDIAIPRQRGFSGVAWRVQAPGDFEHFYLRHHQSGNPDANQYTPEFHGLSAWQLYYGSAYSAPIAYRFDQWMRVRVVVSGSRAEVYLDSEKPVLYIPELKREVRTGGLALTSSMAGAYFSNFRYEVLPDVELSSKPQPPPPLPFAIAEWLISSPFSAARLTDRISAAAFADLRWTPLPAEATGITNLARLHGVAKDADTVFARVVIHSRRAQLRRLRFGFSDRAQVYLNGELLYRGDDRYASRDYRFLGTMGLFDELPLRLREGRNELWLAVSEEAGGWGVMAALDSFQDLRIVTGADTKN